MNKQLSIQICSILLFVMITNCSYEYMCTVHIVMLLQVLSLICCKFSVNFLITICVYFYIFRYFSICDFFFSLSRSLSISFLACIWNSVVMDAFECCMCAGCSWQTLTCIGCWCGFIANYISLFLRCYSFYTCIFSRKLFITKSLKRQWHKRKCWKNNERRDGGKNKIK